MQFPPQVESDDDLLSPKQAHIIFGIAGQLCAGKEEVVKHLWGIIQLGEIYELTTTFDEAKFFGRVLQQSKNLKTDDDDDLEKLAEIVEKVFQEVHNEQSNSDVELIKHSLERWYCPQIIYPIVNRFQVTLLEERNYFHLISVEAPTLVRYGRFCKKYPSLVQSIDLAFFTFIDDEISIKPGFLDSCRKASKVHVLFDGTEDCLEKSIGLWEWQIFREVRPPWEQYFMYMAHVVKLRSNCMKRAVGAIIVKRDRIISTGYNGTPYGKINCFEGGCQRCNSNVSQGQSLEKCFCFHAEENAILEIGTKKTQRAVLYTTLFPCSQCTKLIIAAGIKELYYEEDYNNRSQSNILLRMMKVAQVSTKIYVH